jgi:putative DNA primase/helicase
VFAHGTGGNGKGTFLNTLVGILGDYATVADTSTFVASRGERHPTDVAHLVGARLVVAQETQEGRRWNESRIKEMTGGDRMTARFMRQDYFDFEPTHKLFITGNHKPSLASVDPAIKRRLLLVPFLVQIPDAERDPDLRDKLRTEWPAILRWAVNGAQDWQRIGLQPPAIVQNATADYFAAEDTLALWSEDCLVPGDESVLTSARELYASWRQWCEDRGYRPGSQKEFSSKLQDKGLEYKRTNQARGFYAKLAKI